jgi:hypothetical protein
VASGQKKAPNTLKSLDASLKSSLVFRRRAAGRAPSEAAECGPAASKNVAEKGRLKEKNLEGVKGRLEAL